MENTTLWVLFRPVKGLSPSTLCFHDFVFDFHFWSFENEILAEQKKPTMQYFNNLLLYFHHLYYLCTYTHALSFFQLCVSSDSEDYQKEYKKCLMYIYLDFHFKSKLLLNITMPPLQSEATHTTTNVSEGGIIMKLMNEENKGKERSNNLHYNKQALSIIILFNTEIQVQVYKIITLAQLKEELVPLIGVPSTGFIVYGIRYGEEYEMEGLDETLEDIKSGSEVI